MKKQTKRLFITVEIHKPVVKEIERIQKFLKKQDLFRGRYVSTAHAHITLKFLGDVDETDIPKIQERLHSIKQETMHAELGKLDLFKSGKKPRVIFLNIDCPALTDLAQKIEDALGDLFPSEDPPFVSHLTLVRVKEIDDYDILDDLLEAFTVTPLSFTIDSFVLKESALSSEGPTYCDVETYKL